MRFVADMNVSQAVVEWLRGEGHGVWHVRERGMQSEDDRPILETASQEGRILLTIDLDFGDILATTGGRSSVITFRTRVQRTPFVIERLFQVIDECAPELQEGAIVTVEDSRHRVRTLPLWEEDD